MTKHVRPWFRIEPTNVVEPDEETETTVVTSTSADVFIYDEIGESFWGGGVSAQTLATELAALEADVIRVFINSPGGAAWDGIAIMNSLRRHSARIEVTVDGLAASAASVIAMAGDTITMNRGSELMIHDASGGAYGNAEYLEETASILHKLSDSIADIYAARAGGDRETWRAAMVAETWYTADEAVAAGLADAATEEPAAQASFDRSRFTSRARANAPRAEAPELPAASASGDHHRKESVVSYDDLKAGLRQRLGVNDANATDDQLIEALDESLAERAEPTPAATAQLPAGTIAVDAAAFKELQANAAAGANAAAELASQRRDGIVNKALREGRIAASSRETFRAQLDADEEGTSKLLNSLPANTVPVAEIGKSDSLTSADDALYAGMFGDEQKGA